MDFATALQDLITAHAEQYLIRLKKRPSLFEADKRDLDTLLQELGNFFAIGEVDDENLALTIMQRQDQIHLKRTVYPLINTLVREFRGIQVTWEPLYAPVDQEAHPYGDLLLIEREISETGIPRDEWFLTSRGVIRVPMLEVRRSFGNSASDSDAAIQQFESLLRRVIYPLIPLRIVCDGQQYYLSFDLIEAMESINSVSDVSTTTKPIAELDETLNTGNAGVADLPAQLLNNRDPIKYTPQNRFDAYRFDAVGIDRYIKRKCAIQLDEGKGFQFDSPLALPAGCDLTFEFVLKVEGWNSYLFDGRSNSEENDDLHLGYFYSNYPNNAVHYSGVGSVEFYKNGVSCGVEHVYVGDHVRVVLKNIHENKFIWMIGNRYTLNEPTRAEWLSFEISNAPEGQNHYFDLTKTFIDPPSEPLRFYSNDGEKFVTLIGYEKNDWVEIS